MRFSFKWILAATLYVALAVAALARGQWYFADAFRALTLLTVVCAILLISFARGRRVGIP
jgi:hypothetical protein